MKQQKYFRNCPECNKEIGYTLKYDRDNSEKKLKLCKSCAKKGNKNSFYNKKHTEQSKLKIIKSQSESTKYIKHLNKLKTCKYKKELSKKFSGKNNPAYNRGHLKDLWIKKYGKEIAEQKDLEWRKKLSQKSSGQNNNMYGKPSPQGSGNGWSGWYKGWFFRSLTELSFMINYIERFNIQWEVGEQKKYKISYIDWNNKNRNYFPDFIINNKYMIECKPKRLHNSNNVICKKNSAIEFCKKNNLKYKLINPIMISDEKLKFLYLNNKLQFIKKYNLKFKQYFNLN